MSNELDPARVRAALRRCEAKEREASELEAQALRLRGSASAMRVRWGLPPAGRERPEFRPAV